MFEKLNFDMNKVYPTLVVSTMSSGKSTLINALVGADLLPSMNRACTAKSVAILDNDRKSQFEVHVVDQEGTYTFIEKATKGIVKEFNQSDDIAEMIIEGEIKGIHNSKKSLLLVDTPGINNSMDMNHEQVTKSVLEEYSEGLILYVINAQQIGTYDDRNFLTLVAQKLRDCSGFNIIFVVNKMDSIDPAKESPEKLMENCKAYIQDIGIENPVLIPVSAGSALIFKKALEGEQLTELEEEEFLRNYRHFKREGFSLLDYVSASYRDNMSEKIMVDGAAYTRAQICAALDNTGLPFLESQIDETLVRSLKIQAPRITVRGRSNKGRKRTTQKRTLRKKTKVSKHR